MNLNCFVCNEKFDDCKKLFCHLKHLHHLLSNQAYECGFPKCTQKFDCFKNFSKHMVNEVFKCSTKNATSSENIHEKLIEPQRSILRSSEFLSVYSQNERHDSYSPPNTNYFSENTAECVSHSHLAFTESSFTLTLRNYANPHFSRKQAKDIQNNIKYNITHPIKNEIMKVLKGLRSESLDNTESYLSRIASFCDKPFDTIDSEYKFIQKLKKMNLYESPKLVSINNTIANLQLKHFTSQDVVQNKGVIFPIKFQMKKFFELDGVLEGFEENIKNFNDNNNLKNFCCGKLWKDKIRHVRGKDLYIPYLLYFDDFEINNPLGSHSSSLLAIYYSFPSAPIPLKFKLDNIFIAALFKSVDVKNLGNEKCFYKLIETLNEIESNGILIEKGGIKRKVFLCLGLVVGDNLLLIMF
ncbi:uncharacterized protein LOC142223889 isoform X1 [Haematobia irritans]|uniref:uncharacterized protein LOC142223889 isoform X1 n=1 Tax=Haematobia irritans TaxID=7368 RepID=UPI003F4FB38A